MKPQPPTMITVGIAVVLVLLGILAGLGAISALSAYALWIVVLGFIVLLLGNFVKGM